MKGDQQSSYFISPLIAIVTVPNNLKITQRINLYFIFLRKVNADYLISVPSSDQTSLSLFVYAFEAGGGGRG